MKALYARLEELDYTPEGLEEILGPDGLAAMYRGEPAAVRFALERRASSGNSTDTDTDTIAPPSEAQILLIRTLVLRDALSATELATLFDADSLIELESRGWLVDGRITIDIRPHFLGGRTQWVFSDQDAAMSEVTQDSGHVLGVGQASLSLLRTVPTNPVISVLDLGTGSGVQILGQAGAARVYVGTDIAPRAKDFALASVGSDPRIANQFEFLTGSWFEPVADRRFDRIIANPPFVVGTGAVGHVYRDSGLALDGASQLVVSQAVDHLTLGGRAHILAAWVETKDDFWASRPASWIPATGVRAWVCRRDSVDPALYVGTWLRDEGIDPRSARGQEITTTWLSFLEESGVDSIGFGFIHLERLAEGPSEVHTDELMGVLDEGMAAEVNEFFLRAQWLTGRSAEDIANTAFLVRPGTAYEEVSVPAGSAAPHADPSEQMGFSPVAHRITRMDGPHYSHEIDENLYAILSGLNPRGLALGEVVTLFAYSHGIEDEEALMQQSIAAIVDLVRHGIVLPAELVLPR
ncbi:MAG: methyltransferase [Corynebacterium sp.]|nr:methyltransferase [Corynebacterium sp.]